MTIKITFAHGYLHFGQFERGSGVGIFTFFERSEKDLKIIRIKDLKKVKKIKTLGIIMNQI